MVFQDLYNYEGRYMLLKLNFYKLNYFKYMYMYCVSHADPEFKGSIL